MSLWRLRSLVQLVETGEGKEELALRVAPFGSEDDIVTNIVKVVYLAFKSEIEVEEGELTHDEFTGTDGALELDLSSYRRIWLVAQSTLDEVATLTIEFEGLPGEIIEDTPLVMVKDKVYNLNVAFPWLDRLISEKILIVAKCASNPGSGSLNVIMYGETLSLEDFELGDDD